MTKILRNIEIPDILQYQRNRHPMLYIDKVVEVKPGEYSISEKVFSYNEWFFPHHFEDDPNVPGHIIIECMVQSFIMTFLTIPEYKGLKTNFLKVNDATFKSKIVPTNKALIYSTLNYFKRGVAKGQSVLKIDDKIVSSANFIVCLPKIIKQFNPANEIS